MTGLLSNSCNCIIYVRCRPADANCPNEPLGDDNWYAALQWNTARHGEH